MNILKKISIFCFAFLGILMTVPSLAQISPNPKIERPIPPVEFSKEEIEKVKTLIEHHLKTRISEAQFSKYGKATEKNLALFKTLDKTKKDNAFFSQPHISYIIESMELRLGKKRPPSKSSINASQGKREFPKVSKLPKHKRDNS